MGALGRIDAVEAAFLEESVSPVHMVERNKKLRQRASAKTKTMTRKRTTKELDW